MRKCAAKAQILSKCRIRHSSQSAYFDAVALSTAPFQLRNRIRRKLLWLRQVVSVFDRFFLEPFEAGELELAILHYPDGEAPPAVFLRVAGLARVRYCAGICAASGRKALFFRGT